MDIPRCENKAPPIPLPIIHCSSIPHCQYWQQPSIATTLFDSLPGLSGSMPMLPLDFFLKTNTATAESPINFLKDLPRTVALEDYTRLSHPNAREKGQKLATYVLVHGKDLLEDEAHRRHEAYETAVESGIARSGPTREPQRRQCEHNHGQAIRVTHFGRAFTSSSTQQLVTKYSEFFAHNTLMSVASTRHQMPSSTSTSIVHSLSPFYCWARMLSREVVLYLLS